MQDRFGHRISYLRVSITDRCNERCTYCMPEEGVEWLPRGDLLGVEEIERIARVAHGLGCARCDSPAASLCFASTFIAW